jgi:hypothetical protein
LSAEAQQDLAQQIEDLTEPLDDLPAQRNESADDALPPSVRAALALAGAWSDLQHDDEFMALDRIRHESTPTPSLEEQLTWLDERDG